MSRVYKVIDDTAQCKFCGLFYGFGYLARPMSHDVLGKLCHLCLFEVLEAEVGGREVCSQTDRTICNNCRKTGGQAGKLCMSLLEIWEVGEQIEELQ